MFSVIFEVHPKQEKFDLYLELAKGLMPILKELTASSTTNASRARSGGAGFYRIPPGAMRNP